MNEVISIALPKDLWESVRVIVHSQQQQLSFASSQSCGVYKEMVEFEAYACQSLVEVIDEALEFNTPQ